MSIPYCSSAFPLQPAKSCDWKGKPGETNQPERNPCQPLSDLMIWTIASQKASQTLVL